MKLQTDTWYLSLRMDMTRYKSAELASTFFSGLMTQSTVLYVLFSSCGNVSVLFSSVSWRYASVMCDGVHVGMQWGSKMKCDIKMIVVFTPGANKTIHASELHVKSMKRREYPPGSTMDAMDMTRMTGICKVSRVIKASRAISCHTLIRKSWKIWNSATNSHRDSKSALRLSGNVWRQGRTGGSSFVISCAYDVSYLRVWSELTQNILAFKLARVKQREHLHCI